MTRQQLQELIYIGWEEFGKDGLVKPDGCSVHLTEEDSSRYLQNYWESMKDSVWENYSRPMSRSIKVLASPKLYALTIRFSNELGGFRLDEDSATQAKESGELILEEKLK